MPYSSLPVLKLQDVALEYDNLVAFSRIVGCQGIAEVVYRKLAWTNYVWKAHAFTSGRILNQRNSDCTLDCCERYICRLPL
jgi:hypothetical protein